MPKFCLTILIVLISFVLYAQDPAPQPPAAKAPPKTEEAPKPAAPKPKPAPQQPPTAPQPQPPAAAAPPKTEEPPKPAEPQNVALGKKYTLSPTPTYKHCTDPEDTVQLTDGQTTTAYFWTQKGTVGWQSQPYAVIQLDLEKVEPISGVDVTTAAGVAGVTWPMAVFVQMSDDGKVFRQVADLVTLDLKAKGPWPEKYGIRCLEGRNLQTRGRFVRILIISTGAFIFTDEIRLWRGDDAQLQGEAKGEIVESDLRKFFERQRVRFMLRRRFDTDIAEIRKALSEAKPLSDVDRKTLADRINAVEKAAEEAIASKKFPGENPQALKEFKAILPFSDFHAELFKVQSALWKTSGLNLHAVSVSPWDKTPLYGVPSAGVPAKVEVHAMQGEYRAAAINLYNATQEPVAMTVRLDGIPATEYTVHDVPWTDTTQYEPVLAALPIAEKRGGVTTVTVLPGLPKQVYLTFRPTMLLPKVYEAKIDVRTAGDGREVGTIPMSLKVWPMKFPEKTSLLVGGWSYTNGNGAYSVTPKNRESFLKHLKERFVNAPWARPSVVMAFNFDKEAVKLDTKEWDAWQAQWPDAKEYCIFLSVGPTIKGVKYDAPEFEAAVGRWINAWVAHWKSQGIEPERFNLLVADEPGLGFALDALYAWSRAIRKAQPKLKLWTDPVYTDLSKAPTELFELSNVICPNRPQWLNNRKGFDAFYVDGWQKKGKTLHLYSCSGPARLLDPYSYYRLQAWDVARINGTASFFWALGDGGGASSWNEYLAPRNMYTPLFIDPDAEQVTAGKQMEAIRESVEDFETIQMLRTLIDKRKATGKSVEDAEKTLREAFETVLGAENVDKIYWKDAKDRTIADRVRVKLLEAIEKFGN